MMKRHLLACALTFALHAGAAGLPLSFFTEPQVPLNLGENIVRVHFTPRREPPPPRPIPQPPLEPRPEPIPLIDLVIEEPLPDKVPPETHILEPLPLELPEPPEPLEKLPPEPVEITENELPLEALPESFAEPQLEGHNVEAETLHNPKPRYPFAALRRGLEGTVVLQVTIDSEGQPADVRVLESSGVPSLDASALKTVHEQWTFRPAQRLGQPVPSTLRLPVVFSIQN